MSCNFSLIIESPPCCLIQQEAQDADETGAIHMLVLASHRVCTKCFEKYCQYGIPILWNREHGKFHSTTDELFMAISRVTPANKFLLPEILLKVIEKECYEGSKYIYKSTKEGLIIKDKLTPYSREFLLTHAPYLDGQEFWDWLDQKFEIKGEER